VIISLLGQRMKDCVQCDRSIMGQCMEECVHCDKIYVGVVNGGVCTV
jgi:hypothetical protein